MRTISQCLYPYAPTQPDELQLAPGEYVVVNEIDKDDDGWARANKITVNAQGNAVEGTSPEGLIPLNFIKELLHPPQFIVDHFAINLSKPVPNKSTNSAKAPAVIPLTNPPSNLQGVPSTAGKVAMLKQALGSNDQFLAGIKNAPKPINTTSQPQLAPSGEPIVCQALIMFDYAAQQPDELTLKRGWTIDVVSRDADVGWWKGIDPTGREGVFPKNFAEEVIKPVPAQPSNPLPVARGNIPLTAEEPKSYPELTAKPTPQAAWGSIDSLQSKPNISTSQNLRTAVGKSIATVEAPPTVNTAKKWPPTQAPSTLTTGAARVINIATSKEPSPSVSGTISSASEASPTGLVSQSIITRKANEIQSPTSTVSPTQQTSLSENITSPIIVDSQPAKLEHLTKSRPGPKRTSPSSRGLATSIDSSVTSSPSLSPPRATSPLSRQPNNNESSVQDQELLEWLDIEMAGLRTKLADKLAQMRNRRS